jgi:hypothetical protein
MVEAVSKPSLQKDTISFVSCVAGALKEDISDMMRARKSVP